MDYFEQVNGTSSQISCFIKGFYHRSQDMSFCQYHLTIHRTRLYRYNNLNHYPKSIHYFYLFKATFVCFTYLFKKFQVCSIIVHFIRKLYCSLQIDHWLSQMLNYFQSCLIACLSLLTHFHNSQHKVIFQKMDFYESQQKYLRDHLF